MIRKIIVLLLIFMYLFSLTALANDGGNMIDDQDYLSIKVILKSDETQIGSLLELEVIFTNNSPDDITLMYIRNIFANTPLIFAEDIIEPYGPMDIVIVPGKQAVVELSVIVPEIVHWYYKDLEYYFDIDLQVEYIAGTRELDMWQYVNDNFEPIKIKITNISDGSDFLDLSLVEDESVIVFMDNCDSAAYAYRGEMPAVIHNRVIAENIGDVNIDYLYLKNYDRFNWHSAKKPVSLAVDGTLIRDIANSYYLKSADIKKKLTGEYRATFRIGDDYYAAQRDKEFDTDIIELPLVEFMFLGDGTVDVKNKSGKDYENIYIDFESDTINLIKGEEYTGKNTLEVFSKNETINLPVSGDNQRLTLGYIIDDILYHWVVYVNYIDGFMTDDKSEEFSVSLEGEYGRIELNLRKDIQVGETPEPTAEPTSTPKPTQKPTREPKPTPTEVPTPSPTIEPTPTPSNTPPETSTKPPADTDKLDEDVDAVTIDSVEFRSSLPIWVLLLLGTAVIYSGTLIYILRKNSKFKG